LADRIAVGRGTSTFTHGAHTNAGAGARARAEMPAADLIVDAQQHHKSAARGSVAAGVIFGAGWLIFVDAAAGAFLQQGAGGAPTILSVAAAGTPLAAATFSLVALNTGVDHDAFHAARDGPRRRIHRARALGAISVGLVAIAGAVFLLMLRRGDGAADALLAGTAATSSNLIIVAAVLFWAARAKGPPVI